MDNITQKIRHRFDHEAAKQTLREKYEAKLLFAHQGGMFRAGPELIILLNSYDTGEMVILDEFNNPTKVTRLALLDEVKQRYQEQLNAWMVELAEISRQR
jgi:hypothetical protein